MVFKCEKSKPSITYINTGNPVRAQRIGMSILDKGPGSFWSFMVLKKWATPWSKNSQVPILRDLSLVSKNEPLHFGYCFQTVFKYWGFQDYFDLQSLIRKYFIRGYAAAVIGNRGQKCVHWEVLGRFGKRTWSFYLSSMKQYFLTNSFYHLVLKFFFLKLE